MANQFLTLKDITAAKGASPAVGMVDNIVNVCPELDRILGRPIPGISEISLILTALGNNAAFRKIGGGVALSAPSFDRKRFGCMPWDAQLEVPEDILIEMEGSQTPNMVFERMTYAAMRQKALKLGQQFYLGSGYDANGPMGCYDFLAMQRTQVDSRTGLKIDQVIDCGGTTPGNCQTIWFIKMGPADVCWLFGRGRGIIQNTWFPQRTASVDSTTNNPLYRRAWVSNVFGYIGTSFANYHAIGALINVDVVNGTVAPTNGTGGNGLFNDTVIADLYAKWPITESADLCLMTKKSAAMLQKTRSVTNFVSGPGREFTTGIAPIANFPTDLPTFNRIPVVCTDSIQPANQIVLN